MRAACRAHEATERERQQRERLAERLRAAAAREQPALAAAAAAARAPTDPPALPVVWLRPVQRQLLPLSAAERTAHAAHLHHVLAENVHLPDWQGQDDQASADTPQARALCTQCRGACCAFGGPNHAFIDAAVLRRWLDAHPGRSEADAIRTWLDWLPPRHVEGACLYQGARGCVLQRRWRAQVCNAYYCEPLQQVQAAARTAPGAPVLAITAAGERVQSAALLAEGRIAALRSRGGTPGAGRPSRQPRSASTSTTADSADGQRGDADERDARGAVRGPGR
jgi:hypothetical protein